MPENVSIAYRGANYALGQGPQFYGIWPAAAPQAAPLEWWPHTPEGWSAAWARFASIEVPGSIVQVYEPVRVPPAPAPPPAAAAPPVSGPPPVTGPGPVLAPASPPAKLTDSPAASGSFGSWTPTTTPLSAGLAGLGVRSAVAIAFLGIGVVLGLIGLFPSYTFGESLASQSFQVVPHSLYLVTWAVSAVLIAMGGARLRVGALLALGMSVVTLGLFIADAGFPIADGSHVMGSGLVLSILGWLACTVGAVVAVRHGEGRLTALAPHERVSVSALVIAGIGAAIAFAPSWDSFTLRAATGQSQTITLGNAFSNPGAVIFGDVVTMVALAAVVIVAAFWRPIRLGAALLAGAIVPLLGQVVSALLQVGIKSTPEQFGYSAGEAHEIGLTISNGLTAIFWVFCAFVATMVLLCAWMIVASDTAPPAGLPYLTGYPAGYGSPAAAGVGPLAGGFAAAPGSTFVGFAPVDMSQVPGSTASADPVAGPASAVGGGNATAGGAQPAGATADSATADSATADSATADSATAGNPAGETEAAGGSVPGSTRSGPGPVEGGASGGLAQDQPPA